MWRDLILVGFYYSQNCECLLFGRQLTHSLTRMDNRCLKYKISLTKRKERRISCRSTVHTFTPRRRRMIRLRFYFPFRMCGCVRRNVWHGRGRVVSWPHLLTIILPSLNFSPKFHPAGRFLLRAVGCQRWDQRPDFRLNHKAAHTHTRTYKHKGTYREEDAEKEKKYHMYQEPDSSRGHTHIVLIHAHMQKDVKKSQRGHKERRRHTFIPHGETYRNKSRHMKPHFKRAAERPKGLRWAGVQCNTNTHLFTLHTLTNRHTCASNPNTDTWHAHLWWCWWPGPGVWCRCGLVYSSDWSPASSLVRIL